MTFDELSRHSKKVILLMSVFAFILQGSCIQHNLTKAMQKAGKWPIQKAAASGDLKMIIELVEAGEDVNFSDMFSVTPLAIAAKKGHIHIISYLIDKGAVVNKYDYYQKTPLFYAVMHNNFETAKLLLESGANPDVCSGFSISIYEGYTLSCIAELAAHTGKIEMVDLLIKYNPQIIFESQIYGAAVSSGNLELLKYFANLKNIRFSQKDRIVKDRYAMVESFSGMGPSSLIDETPLHIASKMKHLEIVKYLLAKKVPVNALNSNYLTPLDVAVSTEIIHLLKSYGGKKNKPTSNLIQMIEYSSLEEVKNMLKDGAKINSYNQNGDSILHVAVNKENNDVLECLLLSGADPNIRTKKDPYADGCHV